ncbi:MAG: bifunctional phosphopantothenoylcysteine decarboxylase/phosphopantothenate--cysteine ligase CoaBC [Propioniciclava sp.]
MSRIVLGVAGGIAAYKSCEVLRRLREGGHDVTVVPTPNALRFVGRTTWEALSGRPVSTSVFDSVTDVAHVRIGQEADLVVVAPATADILARAAGGRADDLLANVLLTTGAPVLFVPAMHTEMWLHPATRATVETLRSRGALIMDPAHGRLTGADSGPGRLPEPEEIVEVATAVLNDAAAVTAVRARDLTGRRVVVSAGGTREPLDPVRFLGNASSGRQGIALAQAARLRGAQVTLVVGQISHPEPSGVELVRVDTTAALQQAMRAAAIDADALVMAAAPADFTPGAAAGQKLSKDGAAGLDLHLVQTPDVLAGLSHDRLRSQVIVGFAAETAADPAELEQRGRAKLARKGCDLLVCNNVSGGAVFGSSDNDVIILDSDRVVARASGSKATIAHRIWDAVLASEGGSTS